MLKIAPQSLLQFNPLDDVSDLDPPELPSRWTGEHCSLRLCEGRSGSCRSRARRWDSKMAGRGGISTSGKIFWPCTSRSMTRSRRPCAHRIGQPSLREVTRCEAVIAWGGQYLRGFDHLCKAVNMVALAHSLGRDAGWCTRKRGGYADTWRQRHDKGCAIIAAGLIRDRISVF